MFGPNSTMSVMVNLSGLKTTLQSLMLTKSYCSEVKGPPLKAAIPLSFTQYLKIHGLNSSPIFNFQGLIPTAAPFSTKKCTFTEGTFPQRPNLWIKFMHWISKLSLGKKCTLRLVPTKNQKAGRIVQWSDTLKTYTSLEALTAFTLWMIFGSFRLRPNSGKRSRPKTHHHNGEATRCWSFITTFSCSEVFKISPRRKTTFTFMNSRLKTGERFIRLPTAYTTVRRLWRERKRYK